MAEEKLNDQAIFEAARRIDSHEARATYLQQSCGEDLAQAERIVALLRAFEENASFLESPAVDFGLAPTFTPPVGEKPGTQIGPYKLLQIIGEGGMGVVYMAEQSEPVKRKVALKLIKAGMDSRQVIARFEAERQALSMMDHVNIARVLDAGTTSGEPGGVGSGTPYFVMELIHGIPITKYCDDNHLTPRQRLELFVPVCQAIQHAHQKGIIHRDIKPSNVMVTLYDGKPVPKVIDFGVAKATEQKLTERTLFTQYGTMVGTLEYMSPEQAEMSALGVDTRSDIYSLGVLLYELLTGSTPLSQKRMREVAFAEVLRLIKEEEPPKPSTRLSESGDSLPSISAQRHMEPARLTQLMRGELDWIVMKTLEKDRNRRYETANGFAADVLRYLNDEQVQACPPSASYRVRKFVRRNRVSIGVTGLFLIASTIALGGIASGLGWAIRDREAREASLKIERDSKSQLITSRLEAILGEVTQLAQANKWLEALQTAERAEIALATGDAPAEIQLRVRRKLENLRLIQRLEAIRDKGGTIWGWSQGEYVNSLDKQYFEAMQEAGVDIDNLSKAEAVHSIRSRAEIASALLPALDDWVVVRNQCGDQDGANRLIDILRVADPDDWRRRVRDALRRKDYDGILELIKSSDIDRQPAATQMMIVSILFTDSRAISHLAGDALMRRAQFLNPGDFWINHRLGVNLVYRNDRRAIEEGIGFLRAAVAIRPYSSHSMMNLGNGYLFLSSHYQASLYFRRALSLSENSAACQDNLGSSLARLGRHDEAAEYFELAIESKNGGFAESYSELSMVHSSRPEANKRKFQRALELAKEGIAREPGFSYPWIALGAAHARLCHWEEAIESVKKGLSLAKFHWNGEYRNDDSLAWLYLAMCQHSLGQSEAKLESYRQGIAVMDKHLPNDEWLIDIQSEVRDLLDYPVTKGDANRLFEAACTRASNATAIRTDALVSAIEVEQQAEKEVEASLSLLSRAVEAGYNKAWDMRWDPRLNAVRNKRKYHAIAALAFKAQIKADPTKADHYHGLGSMYAFDGQWDLAGNAFQNTIDISTRDHHVHAQLASVYCFTENREMQLRLCNDTKTRFSDSTDVYACERSAKLCALWKDMFTDNQQLEKWADLAVKDTQHHPDYAWFAFAKSLVELRVGRFDSAVQWVMRFPPVTSGNNLDASRFSILAIANLELGNLDKGAEALVAAQSILKENLPNPEEDNPFGYDFNEWLIAQTLAREAASLLEEKTVAEPLGIMYAVEGQWELAATAYQKKVEKDVTNDFGHLQLASILHYLQRQNAYQLLCREIHLRFGDSPDRHVCERSAKACALWKGAFTDFQQLEKWSDHAVTGAEGEPDYFWFALAKSLVELRVGRFESAIKWVEKAPSEKLWPSTQVAKSSILAIAHLELGNLQNGEEALAGANTVLKHKLPNPPAGRPYGLDFNEWLVAQVLNKEANELLIEKTAKNTSQ